MDSDFYVYNKVSIPNKWLVSHSFTFFFFVFQFHIVVGHLKVNQWTKIVEAASLVKNWQKRVREWRIFFLFRILRSTRFERKTYKEK